MTLAESDAGKVLLPLARAAIANRLGIPVEEHGDAQFLQENGASFVTLTLDGRLRGCIGTLSPFRSLLEDVRENAVAAAFRDPRFKPVDASQYEQIRIGVSVLSPMTPMSFRDEADARSQLQPGVDGIVFICDGKRSTFLPQVWESLPSPQRFLEELKRKAGLPAHFWSDNVRLSRYHVDKWSEETTPVASNH